MRSLKGDAHFHAVTHLQPVSFHSCSVGRKHLTFHTQTRALRRDVAEGLRELGKHSPPTHVVRGFVHGEIAKGFTRLLGRCHRCFRGTYGHFQRFPIQHQLCISRFLLQQLQLPRIHKRINSFNSIEGRVPLLRVFALQQPLLHLLNGLLIPRRYEPQCLNGSRLGRNAIVKPRIFCTRCIIIASHFGRANTILFQTFDMLFGQSRVAIARQNHRHHRLAINRKQVMLFGHKLQKILLIGRREFAFLQRSDIEILQQFLVRHKLSVPPGFSFTQFCHLLLHFLRQKAHRIFQQGLCSHLSIQ